MFFHTLRRATNQMWAETAYEVLVITGLSLLPLIGVAAWAYLHQRFSSDTSGHQDIGVFLTANIVRGQLAFYAISNWAAVIWLCSREFKSGMSARALILSLCAAGYFYCGMLISPEPFTPGSEIFVAVSSAIVYALSIGSYFTVTLFEKIRPPSAEDTNKAGAASLKEKLRERRTHE